VVLITCQVVAVVPDKPEEMDLDPVDLDHHNLVVTERQCHGAPCHRIMVLLDLMVH
tara:strand:+ start:116 stop:283 length:168 start_codon:yes stop_codon:yes gene_type:complete